MAISFFKVRRGGRKSRAKPLFLGLEPMN